MINTRDKRASAIGVASPFRVVLPVPDPQPEDQGDRQQLDFTYRGLLAHFQPLSFNTGIIGLVIDRQDIINLTIANAELSNLGIEKAYALGLSMGKSSSVGLIIDRVDDLVLGG